MLLCDGVEKLKGARVLVCGLGGVGGYALEALARAGIGHISVLDCDVFSVSNLNRQILATAETVGKRKTEVAAARVKSINPDCEIEIFDLFYTPQSAEAVDLSRFDYVVDAIDTVTAKLELISRAKAAGAEVISCMGTGNKLGVNFKVADISKTSACPLAKVMRKELKERGISGVKAVYSEEAPIETAITVQENGRHIPGSISYAPAIAGLVMASEVIKDIVSK